MKLAGMICKLDRFLENLQIVQIGQIGRNIYNGTTCTNSCVDAVVDRTPAFQYSTAGLRVIRIFIGHNCMYMVQSSRLYHA